MEKKRRKDTERKTKRKVDNRRFSAAPPDDASLSSHCPTAAAAVAAAARLLFFGLRDESRRHRELRGLCKEMDFDEEEEGDGLEAAEEETATEGEEGVTGVEAAADAAGVAGALPLVVALLLVERRARAMTSESAERATSGPAAAASFGMIFWFLCFDNLKLSCDFFFHFFFSIGGIGFFFLSFSRCAFDRVQART